MKGLDWLNLSGTQALKRNLHFERRDYQWQVATMRNVIDHNSGRYVDRVKNLIRLAQQADFADDPDSIY